jgi:tRNA1Val (adenine37-N6)-methyltransferase
MRLTRLGGLSLYQPESGYRFSIDSILLAFFSPLPSGPIADLGAGCGILTLLLALRGAQGPFTAAELDPLSAQCCQRNLARLPALVLRHDLRLPHPELPAQGFKLLISNPPFGDPRRGRVSPQKTRAEARHQISLALPQLWQSAARLLPAKGRLICCLPPRQLDEALAGLDEFGLTPKRLRLVHGRDKLPARIALLEAVKAAGRELKIEPPFILYQDKNNCPGPELAEIYARLEAVGRPEPAPA